MLSITIFSLGLRFFYWSQSSSYYKFGIKNIYRNVVFVKSIVSKIIQKYKEDGTVIDCLESG